MCGESKEWKRSIQNDAEGRKGKEQLFFGGAEWINPFGSFFFLPSSFFFFLLSKAPARPKIPKVIPEPTLLRSLRQLPVRDLPPPFFFSKPNAFTAPRLSHPSFYFIKLSALGITDRSRSLNPHPNLHQQPETQSTYSHPNLRKEISGEEGKELWRKARMQDPACDLLRERERGRERSVCAR